MSRLAFAVVFVAACGGDLTVTQSAICDGELQRGETSVDSPFDRDGDGYFDANNTNCAATYDAASLDCDDAQADVNPGAVEVTCNGIDEDCDESGTPDGDGTSACVTDFSGQFTLDNGIDYKCAYSALLNAYAVDIHFSTLSVVDGGSLSMTSIGTGQPGTMTGTRSQDGSFTVSRVISGLCTESYTTDGQFVDGDTMDATFTASFSGGGCFDCTAQTRTFTGLRAN